MINSNYEKNIVRALRQRMAHLDREGGYWSDSDRELLTSMFEEGYGITEIAIILQRTEPAVVQQIEKMDLYHRKEHPVRRKAKPKPPACLCGDCQLDPESCRRCMACSATQEDI